MVVQAYLAHFFRVYTVDNFRFGIIFCLINIYRLNFLPDVPSLNPCQKESKGFCYIEFELK